MQMLASRMHIARTKNCCITTPLAHLPMHAPGVPPLQMLASRVRSTMHIARTKNRRITISDGFNPSTRKLMNK